MPLFEWSQELSVKIKKIDEQHKKLVDLINLLHDSMKEGKGRDVMGKVLTDLAEYTRYHFQTEEMLFEKYAYPGYLPHKREHDNLTDQVNELKAKFEQGDTVITMELMGFLKTWLNHHILESDQRYSLFLNSKGVV